MEVTLSYRDTRGSGAPVVLLHGMNGSYKTSWAARGWDSHLAGHGYRVIGIDARGAGSSQAIADSRELRNGPCVDDIRSVLDSCNVQQAHIVGYSMGAGHALRFAANQPERVLTVTLGGLGGIALSMAGYFLESASDSRTRLEHAHEFMGKIASRRSDRSAAYTAAYFEALAQDSLEPLRLEQFPQCLVVVGERDTYQGDFAALAITRQLVDRLPGATRSVLAGLDHAAVPAADEFKEVVTDFLARQDVARSEQLRVP